ncbi:hypothetical protein SLEP1_g48734 [Rubroshorea leprosula]|uniref:Uncharacterized protein n=1 Tax=Rubroshorea leprosula TaxID=152421 RepID=A0AAV5LUI2_9ROSI|nr:hypothetical protein SLEP1_g48734 [Rubroshorea leprosula]
MCCLFMASSVALFMKICVSMPLNVEGINVPITMFQTLSNMFINSHLKSNFSGCF